jgi:uncharacterized protein YndB with AHSA1/START domain
MADIVHNLQIKAPASKVFEAVSSAEGLANWWTKSSSGEPIAGNEFQLWFGPEFEWRAVVSRAIPDSEFEMEVTDADDDWRGTRVGFLLKEADGATQVQFRHTGWPQANEHYCSSTFCWAMYLRLLRRYVEDGEVIPYDDRPQA